MKATGLAILYFLFHFLSTTLTGQIQSPLDWDMEDLICKEQEHADFHLQQRGKRNAYADRTDIYYQSMKWEIDPAVLYITGEITYYFRSKVDDLTELHLDLANDLQVNSISRQGNSLSYTHVDHLLTITLPTALDKDLVDSLTITYEGEPPSNGFGSFEQGSHAGNPIIWTLSEPYGVRDWWPGKQDLVDKIDSVDIYITTPLDQLAASNGKLISKTEVNGKMVHHWQHRYPIVAYLIALAVTNYADYSHFLPLDNGDTLEILNYVYPETVNQSQQATQDVLEILTLYNDLFGTYPFAEEKYGYAQFGWGGGEEHQTMSFMGNFSFNLQAHETAHQWFGDKVTCGSWTEIWLNEGFATYMTGLSFEHFSPDQYWPLWKSSTSNSATSQPGGSVFVDDTTSVNRIFSGRLSYNKGAYVLHMLRWVVGDEAFYQACRDYLDSPGTAYDFGHTEELQAYMEARSGKDLDGFFADWYYGQGFPSYNLTWNQQADSLILQLRQTTSHPSVPFFEMPVPVHASINGGVTQFVLDHVKQNQRFSFPIGNVVVDSVTIDPDIWLLSRNNTVTETTTSVFDILAQDDYLVYPNPAKDYFEVFPYTEIASAYLVDACGKSERVTFINNRIGLDHFAPGYYTLMLKNEKGDYLSIQPVIVLK